MIRFGKKTTKYKKNAGTTLIEMVISFALLGLFVASSTVIITYVTNLYYHVRGESYSRQVGDIVVNKIQKEVAGALYTAGDGYPLIDTTDSEDEDITGNSISLYNREDTGMRIFAADGILQIYYFDITDMNNHDNDRKGVYWTFDKKMYNGYEITDLRFAQANTALNSQYADLYEVADTNPDDYGSNILAVYITLNSGRYGNFKICRYIKMYNYPDESFSVTVK